MSKKVFYDLDSVTAINRNNYEVLLELIAKVEGATNKASITYNESFFGLVLNYGSLTYPLLKNAEYFLIVQKEEGKPDRLKFITLEQLEQIKTGKPKDE